MKLFAAIFILSVTSFVTIPKAQALDINRVVRSLCDYTRQDNRSALRKKLKTSRLQLRLIYASLQCPAKGNFKGGSLLRTASYFGSTGAASLIAARLGKSHLAGKEADGKTIVEWAKSALARGYTTNAGKTQAIVSALESKLAG